MRSYSKVSSKFWTGETGKAIKAAGGDAQRLAFYFLTSPHANMLGLYQCPMAYVVHDIGMSSEEASKALASLIEAGFCHYDTASDMVWVVAMARVQILDAEEKALKPKDKRVVGVHKMLGELPKNPFIAGFCDRYMEAFHLQSFPVPKVESGKGSSSPSEAPSKPGTGTGTGTGERNTQAPAAAAASPAAPAGEGTGEPGEKYGDRVREVFVHWQKVHDHPQAKCGGDRYRKVVARLKEGYTVEQLKLAVDGNKKSPHHQGQNDTGTVYDDLELICRDSSHVERFIRQASAKTAPGKGPAESADDLGDLGARS